MTLELLQKMRKDSLEKEYRELRKTMKHSKAIHFLKDKHGYCYYTISKNISKEVVNEFITTRKMKRIIALQ
ncbi:hypothetical protein [Flavobacterium sp.]|uniref:hypothetical protein n=1 Tax=Flavobacterium sp. TaxID=239 RepID=UPI0037511A05